MRVVIAEDSVLLREGLARVLSDGGFEVVAQAGVANELRRAVPLQTPDVAIVDIRMPLTQTDEGARAALKIRAEQPEVAVLLLSQIVEATHALALASENPAGFGYCSRTACSRSTTSSSRCAAWRRAAPRSTRR